MFPSGKIFSICIPLPPVVGSLQRAKKKNTAKRFDTPSSFFNNSNPAQAIDLLSGVFLSDLTTDFKLKIHEVVGYRN